MTPCRDCGAEAWPAFLKFKIHRCKPCHRKAVNGYNDRNRDAFRAVLLVSAEDDAPWVTLDPEPSDHCPRHLPGGTAATWQECVECCDEHDFPEDGPIAPECEGHD